MSSNPDNPGADRVRYQLRSAGAPEDASNPLISGVHSRGYLPHIKSEGADYFVTFRLADSLPKNVLLQLEAERAERLRKLQQAKCLAVDLESKHIIDHDFRRAIEQYLDQGNGACHLRRDDIAQLVAGAIQFFHNQRYVLREWVVMPNHVHVLFWPMPNYLVSDIVKSWKQFTSLRAKRVLGLAEGSFWQRESYDHWVRNDEEDARIAKYIQENPVKARLCSRSEDWRWSSAWKRLN